MLSDHDSKSMSSLVDGDCHDEHSRNIYDNENPYEQCWRWKGDQGHMNIKELSSEMGNDLNPLYTHQFDFLFFSCTLSPIGTHMPNLWMAPYFFMILYKLISIPMIKSNHTVRPLLSSREMFVECIFPEKYFFFSFCFVIRRVDIIINITKQK